MIFRAQEECTLTLKELLKVIDQERSSLVRLAINEISENTRRKEMLNAQLIQKSKQLKKVVEGQFGTLQDFEEKLTSDELVEWNRLRDGFWNLHKTLKNECEINQNFLKSSLRNLRKLSDNLRRLFGEQPLYSPKGTKVDRSSEGRVLEASY